MWTFSLQISLLPFTLFVQLAVFVLDSDEVSVNVITKSINTSAFVAVKRQNNSAPAL